MSPITCNNPNKNHKLVYLGAYTAHITNQQNQIEDSDATEHTTHSKNTFLNCKKKKNMKRKPPLGCTSATDRKASVIQSTFTHRYTLTSP